MNIQDMLERLENRIFRDLDRRFADVERRFLSLETLYRNLDEKVDGINEKSGESKEWKLRFIAGLVGSFIIGILSSVVVMLITKR